MKTNIKMAVRGVALGFTLSATFALIGQPAQAQDSQHHHFRLSPKAAALLNQSEQLNHDAAAALHAGQYAVAEADVRQAMSLSPLDGVGEEILAAALDAQGKNEEAIQAYGKMVNSGVRFPRILLPYSLLLLKSGRWMQAAAVYNMALPNLAQGKLMQANSHFSAAEPDLASLEVALHIAKGVTFTGAEDWAGEHQDIEAMTEFKKALQLAPNSDLANYYYGSK